MISRLVGYEVTAITSEIRDDIEFNLKNLFSAADGNKFSYGPSVGQKRPTPKED